VTGVLKGIRVLDFGRYVAGPLCATVLADFGADVIRIERRGGSEDRTLVPVTDEGEGAIFLQLGRNKRSLTLDTRKPEAAAILERLIADADVVVANVPPSALAEMGIDYETARKIRPDVVHCNVSSFGAAGPWAERGGFDSIGQAMSGAAFLSGTPDQPVRQPITWVDHAAGLYAAIGTMMALFERQRTGRGQEVQASLLGSALSFSATYLIEQALTGIGRSATLNRSFVNGPTDMFACTDGWIVTQVVGDALFRRWARLIGEPDWTGDARFASDILRGENGAILSERMGTWCAQRSSAEALDALAAAGIPAGPVLSPQSALDHPQVQAMGLFQQVAYAGLAAPLVRMPVELGETPADIRRSPARAGEHNAELLAELGFDAAEVEGFVRDGLI
jgi:crotonobetainyl-CoA:carnitine CoA-transferase CaiB-like acyl-CoA transferase